MEDCVLSPHGCPRTRVPSRTSGWGPAERRCAPPRPGCLSLSRHLCIPRTWVAFTWDPSGSTCLQPARPPVMPRRFWLLPTDLGLRGFQQCWQAWYLGCSSPGPVDAVLTLSVAQSSALGPALLPTELHASWMAGGPHLTRAGLRLVGGCDPHPSPWPESAPECSSGGPSALLAHIGVGGGGKSFRDCPQGLSRWCGLMATATWWATRCSSLKLLCPGALPCGQREQLRGAGSVQPQTGHPASPTPGVTADVGVG